MKGPTPGIEREFVPEFDGNRNESEPVTVWIDQPTESTKRACQKDIRVELITDENGKPARDENGEPRVAVDTSSSFRWNESVVRRCVTRVANYTDAAGKPISNGAELAEHGETEIVAEIAVEIMVGFGMTQEEKKDSGESSASSSAGTSPSNGTVVSAGATDSTSSAVAASA